MKRLVLSIMLTLVGIFVIGCSANMFGSKSTETRSSNQTSTQEPASSSTDSDDDVQYQKESQGNFPLVSTLARDDSLFIKPRYYQPERPLRIGLLMPFRSQAPQIAALAQSFFNASQLALMAQRNTDVLLLPVDTGDTPAQAAQAAQEVINKGADIIIGPLMGPSVAQIAPIARKYAVPTIAFSNDDSVSSNGVYLFSFLPEMDVYTIGTYALGHGLKRFAILAPDTDYGRRTSDYFLRFITQKGGTVVNVFHYPVDEKARRKGVVGSIDMNLLVDTVGQLAQSAKQQPFDAIFIPDGGTSLKTVAPMLPYFHIDTRSVRILGTSLFDDPTLTKIRGLEGAWFPAMPVDAYQEFFIDYQASYREKPTKMATLAYDATNLAISLAQYHEKNGGIPLYLITRQKGFYGATGMFRFTPGGFTERSMSIEQLTRGGIKSLQPASKQFPDLSDAPSFHGQPAPRRKSGLQPGEPGTPFEGEMEHGS